MILDVLVLLGGATKLKTIWDLTRKGNNAQGGLLGSHTSPLMEGNCEDNIVFVPALGDKF